MERTWSVHSLAVPTESYLFLMSSSFSLTNIDHYGGPLALRNVIWGHREPSAMVMVQAKYKPTMGINI